MTELTTALDSMNIEEVTPQAPRSFSWSPYQQAVFDFVANGEGNAVVEAVAGSGKTTTIVQALNYTDPNAEVAFVAFNKRIADELKDRAPGHVFVATTHSLGLKNIRESLGWVKVETRKDWMLWDEFRINHAHKYGAAKLDMLTESVHVLHKLVSMLKATLLEPTDENLMLIADRYNVNINGDAELIFEATRILFQMSNDAADSMVNFDDMIYLCGNGTAPCKKFDFLFIDEAQDLNPAQIEMMLRSVKPGGRVIAVGDRHQSIYGFRGADTEAIPNLINALDATTLPLSITYRCPRLVVELAQRYVPHLEAREGAPDGEIRTIDIAQLMNEVQDEDLIICRVNAPLVRPAFALIRRGIKAVILGREIGQGLDSLIDKVGKRHNAQSLTELLKALRIYRNEEMLKLLAADKTSRAAHLDDQIETILALADNASTIADVKTNIRQVFDDNHKGITFSSVHKVKGGEANRVFILEPQKMPHPMAKAEWEQAQELNIIYVAYTRAIEELIFVEDMSI